MSLNDNTDDKGFSPLSLGFEVDRGSSLGLLSPGRSLTDYSTGLGGDVVTKTKFKLSAGSVKYYLVCSNGKIYESDPLSPPGYVLKDNVVGKTFSSDCHAIVYRDALYITSTTDIYYDDFTFTIKDLDWWTATKSKTALTAGVPHKMFEFGKVLYILNGNKIFSWDGTTARDDAFTLPVGWIITDVEIDNDVIYLTIVKNVNDYSVYSETKIIVWNGISPDEWLREVPVFTTAISAIKKADQGFLFWAGLNIYFFDGYNYTWLRQISTTPNFNQIVAFNGKIYYVDNGVSCYNTLFKIFSNPVYSNTTINVIDITYLDFIDIFSPNAKYYRALTNNVAGLTFYSNRYDLINSYIRKIIVTFSSPLATNSSYTLILYDETGNSIYTNTISKALDGAKSVVIRKNLSKKLNQLQLLLTFNNAANSKIRSIVIYYEPSENYVGK
jgi:hypothetical protein